MTKIDIFSGFLGAGKTTLIKKLIKEAYAGEKLVLIENEFGEIGIDGGFLQDAGINITEMNSGCICCSLVGDFTEALKKVIAEYSPTRVIIEPSGVGKLSDVIRAVRSLDGADAELNALVAVADANKCRMYMKNFGEFYNDQIKHATAIVLSHTANAPEKKIAAAVSLIREHNAEATVITTDWERLSGKEILHAMENKHTLEDEIKALEEEHHHHHHHEHGEHCDCHEHHHEHGEHCDCHEHHHEHGEHCDCHEHHHEHGEHCDCHEHHHEHGEHCDCHEHHHEHGEHHHHHHADEVFTSWGVETALRFDEEKIKSALSAFDSGEYGTVLRAKGIVEATEGGFIHFDYVPEEIDVRRGSAAVIGRICVIGAELKEEKIKELFGV